MSPQNRLEQKRARSRQRAEHAEATRRRVPFAGVIVTRKEVIGQRYNAVKGLPFSPSVAAVLLEKVGAKL